MHNHDEKDGNWMMWAMMLCCAVPLVLILLFGLGGKALGASTWVILGGIAVMLATHFLMMGRSHKRSNKEHGVAGEEGKNIDDKDGKTHDGHGCCH